MTSGKLNRPRLIAMLAVALGTLLQGCVTNQTFATLTAAGQEFPKAQYQVLGKTRYDQAWIDQTIEAEIAGFGFARPQRRPPSLDHKPMPVKAPIRVESAPSSSEPIALPPAKPPKKHRIRDWFHKLAPGQRG